MHAGLGRVQGAVLAWSGIDMDVKWCDETYWRCSRRLFRATVVGLFIGGVAIAGIGLIMAGFYKLGDLLFTQIPPSVLNPPIYPNAQRVVTTDAGDGIRHITFVTSATPAEVYLF